MPFVTRAEWGAKQPGVLAVWGAPPIGIAIHYVGGSGSMNLTSHDKCLAAVRNIQAYAMSGGNGWKYADIEYNLMACPHGYVIEGRGLRWQGAAQMGANATHVSICALANVADAVSPGLDAALRDAIALTQRAHPTAQSVVGHRDTAGNPTGTNCPGDTIEAWIHAYSPTPPPTPPPREDDDPMYVTFQNSLHGFYVSKDGDLWQRWESHDPNKPNEKNISKAVGFTPGNVDRVVGVHEVNGDLVVGVYGKDKIFNEARWIAAQGKWVPHTYR